MCNRRAACVAAGLVFGSGMSDIARLLVDDALEGVAGGAATTEALESELHGTLLSDRWCSPRRPLIPTSSASAAPAPKAFLISNIRVPAAQSAATDLPSCNALVLPNLLSNTRYSYNNVCP